MGNTEDSSRLSGKYWEQLFFLRKILRTINFPKAKHEKHFISYMQNNYFVIVLRRVKYYGGFWIPLCLVAGPDQRNLQWIWWDPTHLYFVLSNFCKCWYNLELMLIFLLGSNSLLWWLICAGFSYLFWSKLISVTNKFI
jgi:hypothetical protein